MWPTSDICSIFSGEHSPEGAWPRAHCRPQACRGRGEMRRTCVQARRGPGRCQEQGRRHAFTQRSLCAGRDTSFIQEDTGSACALPQPPRNTSEPRGPLSELSSENLSPGSRCSCSPSGPVSAQPSPALLPQPPPPAVCIHAPHTVFLKRQMGCCHSLPRVRWLGIALRRKHGGLAWTTGRSGCPCGSSLTSRSVLRPWASPGTRTPDSRASLVTRLLHPCPPTLSAAFNSVPG